LDGGLGVACIVRHAFERVDEIHCAAMEVQEDALVDTKVRSNNHNVGEASEGEYVSRPSSRGTPVPPW